MASSLNQRRQRRAQDDQDHDNNNEEQQWSDQDDYEQHSNNRNQNRQRNTRSRQQDDNRERSGASRIGFGAVLGAAIAFLGIQSGFLQPLSFDQNSLEARTPRGVISPPSANPAAYANVQIGNPCKPLVEHSACTQDNYIAVCTQNLDLNGAVVSTWELSLTQTPNSQCNFQCVTYQLPGGLPNLPASLVQARYFPVTQTLPLIQGQIAGVTPILRVQPNAAACQTCDPVSELIKPPATLEEKWRYVLFDPDSPLLNRVRGCTGTAPDWLRVTFHDCGTYSVDDGTGGCDGSLVTYEERARGDNGGITKEITDLKYIAEQVGLPISDIIVAGGLVSVVECGGPPMPFYFGRKTTQTPNPTGRLPSPFQDFDSIAKLGRRLGLTVVDWVTLFTGSHTLGHAHHHVTPFIEESEKPFDITQQKFDNKIFRSIAMGERQTLGTDGMLMSNPTTAQIVKMFADDQSLFFRQYVRTFTKHVNSGYKDGELQGPIWVGDQGKSKTCYSNKFPYNLNLPEFTGVLAGYKDPIGPFPPPAPAPSSQVGNQCDPSKGPFCFDMKNIAQCPLGYIVLDDLEPRLCQGGPMEYTFLYPPVQEGFDFSEKRPDCTIGASKLCTDFFPPVLLPDVPETK